MHVKVLPPLSRNPWHASSSSRTEKMKVSINFPGRIFQWKVGGLLVKADSLRYGGWGIKSWPLPNYTIVIQKWHGYILITITVVAMVITMHHIKGSLEPLYVLKFWLVVGWRINVVSYGATAWARPALSLVVGSTPTGFALFMIYIYIYMVGWVQWGW